jgi:hypothetical protein
MGMMSCPQCSVANNDRLTTCRHCGAPLPRPTKSSWKLGLYLLSCFLIALGVLFLWASPVANTGVRLIVGIIMIALGVIFILLLRQGAARRRRYYSEEAGDKGLTDTLQLTCKACGAPLSEDSVSMVNGLTKLICPQCREPYVVEEEPKW